MQIQICLALAGLQLAAALLSVPSSDIIQQSTVDFDNAQNAWTLKFEALPVHTFVLVQVCDGSSACLSGDSRFALQTCEQLQAKVQETGWVHSPAPLHNCVPPGTDADLTGVFTEVFPNGIKIANEMEHLRPYGTFANRTLTIHLRVLFIEEIDDGDLRFTVHIFWETLKLSEPTTTKVTVVLQHACPHRGLHTPTAALLHLPASWNGEDDPDKLPCIWKCTENHVRFPFHTYPPTATDPNRSKYVCQPLPADFISVQFVFSVSLQSSSVLNGQYTQDFLTAIDELAHDMQVSMQSKFAAQVLVVLMVPGTIFADEYDDSLKKMMELNALYTGRVQHFENKNLGRRLLQAATPLEISGVMILGNAAWSDLASLRRVVSTEATDSLNAFSFEPALGVVKNPDEQVRVTSLQRALQPPPPKESAFGDTFFYVFLASCASIIVLKTAYMAVKPNAKFKIHQ